MSKVGSRRLGASKIVVPPLGIGWGDTWKYDRDEVNQVYSTFLDGGFTFFDSTEVNGEGASEKLLRDCHRQDGRQIITSSKFAPPLTKFSRKRSTASSLLKALDQTLQRLEIDCLDLYQIHWPSPLLKVDELMEELAKAVKAGKIRAVGVSNYSAALMHDAHRHLARHGIPLASNQVKYNLLHRYPETNGVLDACRELDVAMITYSPLEKGLLTGKYRNQPMSLTMRMGLSLFSRSDPFGDTRGTGSAFRRWVSTPRILKPKKLEPLFEVLEDIAQTHQKTIAQVVLNWLLMKDPCIIPIPSARTRQQAVEIVQVAEWTLTEKEHEQISEAEMATR